MMMIFGVPITVVHALVVELHTGVGVFAFLAILAILGTSIVKRGSVLSPRMQNIRREADTIAYLGGIATVVFLILSGITGYFIYPYSNFVNNPLLLNKSLTALGTLYFWGAFVFIRFWCGPKIWETARLYALNFATAIIAIIFTTLAGSMGAELSPYGQSVLESTYKALGLNFKTLTITQTDIYITAAVFVVLIAVALVTSPRKKLAPSLKVPTAPLVRRNLLDNFE